VVECAEGLDLGDDFERTAGSKLDPSVGEELKAAGESASGPLDAFGHRGELAALAGVEHEDAIRLAEIALADDDRGNPI